MSSRILAHETFVNIPAFNHHLKENLGTHSRQSRRRDIHKAVLGHQWSLRHALRAPSKELGHRPSSELVVGDQTLDTRPDRAQHITQIVNLC